MPEESRYHSQETLHSSHHTLIRRAKDEVTGEAVILKSLNRRHNRVADRARFRHEFEILSSLDIPGVPRALSWLDDAEEPTMVLSEASGESLSRLYAQTPAPLEDFFTVGLAVARILSVLHERSILHKDISPDNIIFDRRSLAVTLIDFGIASTLPRERRLSSHVPLEGTIAFMAPEQTGRLGRIVDARSDLYGLGGTLFYLLTGEQVFQGEDSLELIHAHLARPPRAPSALRANIPREIDAIILKLLEKDCEKRYQSAWGLIADLEEVQERLSGKDGEPGVPFVPARKDRSALCVIPDRCFGREVEEDALSQLLREVSHGESRTCIITGPAGSGKSALARSLLPAVTNLGARFGEGKAEQFSGNAELTALGEAIDAIIDQIPPPYRDEAAGSILEACGSGAALVTAISASTARLLGPLSPPGALPPAEARRRLLFTLARFLRVLSSSEHPLIIFIDDLQWADPLSIDLLVYLTETEKIPGLLCIASWRDEEIQQDQLLTSLSRARSVMHIEVKPLPLSAVHAMIREAFARDESELAQKLWERTGGNPFFIRYLFSLLVEQGAIRRNPQTMRWSSADAIPSLSGMGTDIIDLLLSSLSRFQSETRRVLAAAACIGSSFDLSDLAAVVDAPLFVTARVLEEPLRRELIIPDNAEYRYLSALGPEDAEPEGVPLPFHFVHDRVQQAAAMGIREADSSTFHLRYALILAGLSRRRGTRKGSGENAIELARHLNLGATSEQALPLRDFRFDINLKAGKLARDSASFEAAWGFFTKAWELRSDSTETRDRSTLKSLIEALAETSYLTGRVDEAERHILELQKLAQNPLEEAQVCHLQLIQYTTMGRMDEALKAGGKALSLLGVDLSINPSTLHLLHEILAIKYKLIGWSDQRIASQGPLSDEVAVRVLKLFTDLAPPAYLSGNSNLFAYLVLRGLNYTFGKGLCPDISLYWTALAIILNGAFPNSTGGSRFGELGLSMHRASGDIALKDRIYFLYATFTAHWQNSRTTLYSLYSTALNAALETGDMLYIAFAATHIHQWNPEWDLERSIREGEHSLALIASTHYQDAWDSTKIAHQLRVALVGRTFSTATLSDADFDAALCCARMKASGYTTGLTAWEITMLQLDVSFGRGSSAFAHAIAARPRLNSLTGQPWMLEYWTYGAVASGMVMALEDTPAGQRAQARKLLREAVKKLETWARRCPENFEAPSLLARAELVRTELRRGNRILQSISLYDRAIETARENRFPLIEALACERLASLFLEIGRKRPAVSCLMEACRLYSHLGAEAKFEEIGTSHTALFREYGVGVPGKAIQGEHTRIPSLGKTFIASAKAEDMAALVKASAAISGELSLDRLLERILRVTMENTGADRALIFLCRDGKLYLRAAAEENGERFRLFDGIPLSDFYADDQVRTPPVVLDLIHSAVHSRTPIVVDDAPNEALWREDRRVRDILVTSLLCIPIQSRGSLHSLLYLENTSIKGAFTPERIELLGFLTPHFALSIDSALQYQSLQDSRNHLEHAFTRQRDLMQAYSRFVPRDLLYLMDSDSILDIRLGSWAERELSILCAHLVGAEALADRLTPKEYLDYCNAALGEMEPVILQSEGLFAAVSPLETLALFGGKESGNLLAPDEATEVEACEEDSLQPDSPQRGTPGLGADAAIKAAVDLLRALQEFNLRRKEQGLPPMGIDLSVNTGRVIVGTLGTDRYMEGSLNSEALETARRAQKFGREVGAALVVTSETKKDSLGFERWASRYIGSIKIHGRSHLVALYEIFDTDEISLVREKNATREDFEQAVRSWEAGAREESLKLFTSCLSRSQRDRAVLHYLDLLSTPFNPMERS